MEEVKKIAEIINLSDLTEKESVMGGKEIRVGTASAGRFSESNELLPRLKGIQ
eukprot:CAMPEP_0202974630 /NCGR_PEP_ID=MMETSP1396-20130829/62156_1 /ASSEMBLY_ACC=CAM_ASM_000872 /TAXON_ID= /ORGANISM="Pseudokeronopsis sp., Strain Brazil" /LENGTH=52 /DNA_ID=CAMNT_0049708785 /DNA_START=236 /DNA_END=391 /DNA_ORIENTATION=+